jgi:hypothetical protein
MPQFGYNKNGELEFYAEYAVKGVDSMIDIFPNTKKVSNLLKFKNDQWLRDIYNVENKSVVVRRIFYDFLVLVFNELVNGGMLIFPGKTMANIALKELPDETVKRMVREGTLKNIDIIKSRYKVPAFKFDFGPHSARKDRHIKVPLKIWSKAFRNAENGTIKYTYYRKMLK